MKHLKSLQGHSIGYWNSKEGDADFTPLDYMIAYNPRRTVLPIGFRDMLRELCPSAWFELINDRKVHGWRFRDILEINFSQTQQIEKLLALGK